MKTLNRGTLLQREKLEVKMVDLGNDTCVYVRQMMAYERDKFEQSLRRETEDKEGNPKIELVLDNFRAKLAVVTVCDENGNLIFQPEDWLNLSRNMSADRMDKIVTEAQKLNAITEKDKEALVKNSVVGQADSSSSDSAEKSE